MKEFNSTILPTKYGKFTVTNHLINNQDCVTMHIGDISNGFPLVRIHSSCLFSEALNSTDCDCKLQLDSALEEIQKYGKGILVYLYQEGRGHGLSRKIKAMETERIHEIDTVDAFNILNYELDPRDYSLAIEALRRIQLSKEIRLMSNNYRKAKALEEAGYTIVEKFKLTYPVSSDVKEYLLAKKNKLGHSIEFI
ncbi:GTP cyclohydrolase II RibA [Bacillus cereus]